MSHTRAIPMVEIHRGPFAESLHAGHAVLCADSGDVVAAWGDPDAVVLPRSSAKMIQALPLIASGAAEAFGLETRHLALACASHQGAPLHAGEVAAWLESLGLDDSALICGPEPSRDKALRFEMIRTGKKPTRLHDNCSGKHTGFLTVTRHLKAGMDYVDPDHPLQRTILETFETVTGQPSPGFGVDGCAAPNFATSMQAMARAMAWFAAASGRGDVLSQAAQRLTDAMMARPDLVAGEGRACTLLMQAAREPVALKTGAEGYFVAILPARRQGLALKIADGATRASECALAAILCAMGVLDPAHPDVQRFLRPEIRSRDGRHTGHIQPAPGFPGAFKR